MMRVLKLQYEEHQHLEKILGNIVLGLISQVPSDYMHLVCLGVMSAYFVLAIDTFGRTLFLVVGPLLQRGPHYTYMVKDVQKLYGELLMIFNFCNLLHFSNDVAYFGHLDQFSAFPFGNCMGKIKKLVRSTNHPLQQNPKA
ncbi:hypothetical protein J437_LFUL012113 [Ladona fulva]|uniref:Uncharacterized protein n=1 Tax=Ladona fulva TaxID=123851 RepID=A0A8K0KDK2_LADFU|nr:hypothetical protein J437_LFUL012113 [Ladona fulva]